MTLALLGAGTIALCSAWTLALAARRMRRAGRELSEVRDTASHSAKLLKEMSVIFCRCDDTGVIREASDAFAALAQTDAAGVRGKALIDLFELAEARSDLDRVIRTAVAGKPTEGLTCELRSPGGVLRIIEAELNVLMNDQGDVESILFCGWDVTERERDFDSLMQQLDEAQAALAEQKLHVQDAKVRLEELNSIDAVTHLKNHGSFQEQLKEEMRRSRAGRTPLSLLRVNLDEFKRYNETYGHSAGDAVLGELATTLSASLRGSDFAARYGGDDFVVLLPDTDYLGALEAAERLRAAVESAPWEYQAMSIGVGAATLSRGARRRSVLLAEAEAALEYAKQLGPNHVIHVRDVSPERTKPALQRTANDGAIAA